MENALVHILTALGVAVFGALALRAAKRPPTFDERAQAVVLRHGTPIKVLALISLVLPIPGIVLMIQGPANIAETWLCVGYIWCFGLLAGYAMLEAFQTKIMLVPEGIIIFTAWTGIKSIAWRDIQEITFSGANKWFVIKGPDRRKIRVSIFLVGIAEFETIVRSQLPPERFRKAEVGFKFVAQGLWH
jgi:hypothetical protein